jgi:hypothetical protein
MNKASILPLPKTVCLPFSQEVMTVVIKNWLPLVFGPALAMLNRPGTSCFRLKFSSYEEQYVWPARADVLQQ